MKRVENLAALLICLIALANCLSTPSPAADESSAISQKEYALAPVLPADVFAEPDESILLFSYIGDYAVYSVFPPALGRIQSGAFTGLSEGTGYVIGIEADKLALVPVTVKRLAPTDHDIIEGLRNELENHNIYINQFDAATKQLDSARLMMAHMQSSYSDIEIDVSAARSDCEQAFGALTDGAEDLERARKSYAQAADEYVSLTNDLLGVPDAKNDAGAKVVLPQGFRLGAFIVCGEPLPISKWEDWCAIVEFEKEHRDALSNKLADMKGLAEAYETLAEETTRRLKAYGIATQKLYGLYEEEGALLERAKTGQHELDAAREAKLTALYGLKLHERKVDELKLWFKFRRWLDERNATGGADRDGAFEIGTNEYLKLLSDHESELENSLDAVGKLSAKLPDSPDFPNIAPLPQIVPPDNATSLFAAVWRSGLDGLAPGESGTAMTYFLASGTPDAMPYEMPYSGIPIPEGALTAAGVGDKAITRDAFNRLPEITDAGGQPSALALYPDFWNPYAFQCHRIGEELTRSRKTTFKGNLEALSRYDANEARVLEAKSAEVYNTTVTASLERVRAIMSYMDWRLSYIQAVGAGRLLRKQMLDRTYQSWKKESGDDIIVTRDTLAGTYAKLTGRSGTLELPAELLDFAFGGESIKASSADSSLAPPAGESGG